MSYVVDTDILIYLLKGKECVVKRLKYIDREAVNTTIINHSELFYGVFNSDRKSKNHANVSGILEDINILNYSRAASLKFAELKAFLRKKGSLIDDMDLMIAAICLVNNMILVTNNGRHFNRISDLKLENWSQ